MNGINITKKENDQVDIQLDFAQNAYDRFRVLVRNYKKIKIIMYAYFI